MKDTLASCRFLCVRSERVLLTSDLLPNISLVVGQSSVNISLALCARDISISRLTFNQWYIGQQIIVSKNLFLKQCLKPLSFYGRFNDSVSPTLSCTPDKNIRHFLLYEKSNLSYFIQDYQTLRKYHLLSMYFIV